MYILVPVLEYTFTKVNTVLKIVQSAFFLGLHTNLLWWFYVDRGPLWSHNSKNNVGTAKHTCNGSEVCVRLEQL